MKSCCKSAIEADCDEKVKGNLILSGIFLGIMLIAILGATLFEIHTKLDNISRQLINTTDYARGANSHSARNLDITKLLYKMEMEK